ncbi:MAG: polysaccharide deacetylase family protein [Alphaproteobacteria bacterium]|nr:polysaccharide deacetylase family protein [Alphaproteobacteria bacterium]
MLNANLAFVNQIARRASRFLLAVMMSCTAGVAMAADHASVVMYHRFGAVNLPSTNTTLEQFESHLAELASGPYQVMPLIDITTAIINGEELPDYAVAITVDDAFISLYKEAWPRLKEYGFPVTVFVATNAIDRGLRGYASWDQLREMQAQGVDFGSQTHTHPHMHRIDVETGRQEILTSNNRFIEELGIKPQLFAYPYGEYTPEIRDMIKESGFIAAFGQHSGIMHKTQNHFEFPRFAFNEAYGDLNRFKLAINALPIPAVDVSPESMVLDENPPLYGFTINEEIGPLNRVACFASRMGKVQTIVLDRRIEVRLPDAITGTRGRINCTMPHFVNGEETGRWRWLGRQWLP